MARTARCAPGGMLFHVLNRGNARAQIFDAGEDYHAFQRVLKDTLAHVPMRVLAYCLMPNHCAEEKGISPIIALGLESTFRPRGRPPKR